LRDEENAQMVLRPLVMTSLLLDDFLAANGFFEARSVILSSASSKTALGLAFEVARKRKGRVEVVGVTSSAHVGFVERLGFYDRVVTYDALESLAAGVPCVYVDMAGNSAVLARVHGNFREQLRHICTVGVTHWEQALRTAPNLPGAKPTMFFAPDHIARRNRERGPGDLAREFAADWKDFVIDARRWLTVVEVRGATAMQQSYLEMLEGRTPPDRGSQSPRASSRDRRPWKSLHEVHQRDPRTQFPKHLADRIMQSRAAGGVRSVADEIVAARRLAELRPAPRAPVLFESACADEIPEPFGLAHRCIGRMP
jgi:hypothetical protein